eukprot:scaffold54524_cov17-Prasinocladus_malaysianus.AAC.1
MHVILTSRLVLPTPLRLVRFVTPIMPPATVLVQGSGNAATSAVVEEGYVVAGTRFRNSYVRAKPYAYRHRRNEQSTPAGNRISSDSLDKSVQTVPLAVSRRPQLYAESFPPDSTIFPPKPYGYDIRSLTSSLGLIQETRINCTFQQLCKTRA